MTPLSARKAGFTLIELLVSIGVFSVVMTMAAGAYLVMIHLNERAQAVALASDNLSFALENMVRNVRTGTHYLCGVGDCQGGTTFSFTDASGKSITYTFIAPAGAVKGGIRETVSGTTFDLVDSSVNITSLAFYLSGSQDTASGDYNQPIVRIVVTGTADAEKGQTISFTAQTSATMRGIDL